MGVISLWKILQNNYSLVNINDDLKNKTLAVDLSIWICEGLNIYTGSNYNKLYLRTLFLRTKSLIENGCSLIFIRYCIRNNFLFYIIL